jgi:cellulose biosynthesis protein BcsQ
VAKPPYILAIVSHKGGTGRTTAALALAWAWGRTGRPVTLLDADPIRSASLLALDGTGQCHWPNVSFRAGLEALDGPLPGEVVIVDSPSLLDKLSKAVLAKADGLVLTCLADPLSIRTVPAAATVVETARAANSRLELLGILISIYNERDPVQVAMLNRLRQAHAELLLEPAIPHQPGMRDWPLTPGSDPPAGPARDSFVDLLKSLDPYTRPR